MFYQETPEEKIQRHDRIAKKLEIELERCTKQSEVCLETIGLTIEEVGSILSDDESFTDEQRKQCKNFIADLEMRLKHDEGADPRKNAKTYAILKKAQKWIRVQ